MNKKTTKYYYNLVLNSAKSLKCEQLHHKPKYRHSLDVICPAEYELQRAVYLLEQYLKENGVL